MTPSEASEGINEKAVLSKLQNNREVREPLFQFGQLVRTADIKKNFLGKR